MVEFIQEQPVEIQKSDWSVHARWRSTTLEAGNSASSDLLPGVLFYTIAGIVLHLYQSRQNGYMGSTSFEALKRKCQLTQLVKKTRTERMFRFS